MKIEGEFPQQIKVPQGTEINNGFHEDSESYKVIAPFAQLLVTGPWNNGAYPVQLIENGQVQPESLYLHSPDPNS